MDYTDGGGLFNDFINLVNHNHLNVLEIGSRIVSPGSASNDLYFPIVIHIPDLTIIGTLIQMLLEMLIDFPNTLRIENLMRFFPSVYLNTWQCPGSLQEKLAKSLNWAVLLIT